MTLGEKVLRARSIFPQAYWYWIGLGALLGYTILFNGLFTIFLSYLNRKTSLLCIRYFILYIYLMSQKILISFMKPIALGGSQTVVSEERKDKDGKKNGESVVIQLREFLEHSGSFTGNHGFINRLPFLFV